MRLRFLTLLLLLAPNLHSETYYVAKSGLNSNPGTELLPWLTIQKAADTLAPGDTVLVKAGIYNEKIEINVSGSGNEYITFKNHGSDTVVLDGTGDPAEHIIYMTGKDYIRIIGFYIRNNIGGSGIFVENSGDLIEIRGNDIYDMQGPHGMGITVYGHSSDSITHLKIDSNEIYDCEPATSEALVVNGNVFDFEITNNTIHDVDNIGIDVIGGEVGSTVARRGIVRGNLVYRARSSYGGGYAAGIYVDGGVDITIENNVVYESDMGIEIGCENQGFVVTGCIVRNNLLYNNDKAGLIFGGYDSNTGRVENCTFTNNTLYKNQMLQEDNGEICIQYASENVIENNIIYAGDQSILLASWEGNINNSLDYNCWHPSTSSRPDMFAWNGVSYNTFADYRTATGQDSHSIQDSPEFTNDTTFDFHLTGTSSCIDAGNPDAPPGFDFDGIVRPQDGDADGDSITDIGAYEYTGTPVSSHRSSILSPELSLFPIPAGRVIHIRYAVPDGKHGNLKIYDNAGRFVQTLATTSHAGDHVVEWHPVHIPGGIYFCRLEVEGSVMCMKFIWQLSP